MGSVQVGAEAHLAGCEIQTLGYMLVPPKKKTAKKKCRAHLKADQDHAVHEMTK